MAQIRKFSSGGSFTYNGKNYTAEQLDEFIHNSGLSEEEISALSGTVSAIKNGENRLYDAKSNSLSGNNVNDDFTDYFGSQRRANKGKSGWGRGKRNRHATRQSDFYTRDLALSKLSGIEAYFNVPAIGTVAIPQIPTQAAQVTTESEETPEVELTAEQKLAQLKQQYADSGYDYDKWSGVAELGQDGRLRVRTDELGRPAITGNAYFNDSFVKSIKSDEDTSNDEFEFLKDHFLIDGVFYKASDAKLVGSELYNKLREVNGWYDLNKSGKWDDANKIIRQFWGENESPLKASDFGSYNEVFANNPNLYYRTVTGTFNLTNPDNQVVELFDPTGEVNEFGWYTPKYYEFDPNGNRTHWTNDGKEERIVPEGVVRLSPNGLSAEESPGMSKKYDDFSIDEDADGLITYTGIVPLARINKNFNKSITVTLSKELSDFFKKHPDIWEKINKMGSDKRKYGITLPEWERVLGDKALAFELFQLIKTERKRNQNVQKIKWRDVSDSETDYTLDIPQVSNNPPSPPSMKQGGILKGQEGLPYDWWNNEGEAFKKEFNKLTAEQIRALTPAQRDYAKSRLAATGLKGPESNGTAPVNGTAKEDAWEDTKTSVDSNGTNATVEPPTNYIGKSYIDGLKFESPQTFGKAEPDKFSTFDRNSIKATPYTPEQKAAIEASRKSYVQRGYPKWTGDGVNVPETVTVTEEPTDEISLDGQFARDLSKQDFSTLREEQGWDRARTKVAKQEARAWERLNNDDPAGNLVGESNAGRNYSDLFRIAKLANAFAADKKQRELARQERDAAMSNMEQNVPEYYNRYSDYGIGNQYRQAANQYRQPSTIASSDINAVLADQRIRNAQATQTELEGVMKQSQNFSEWKNQQDQLRRTYAEARTGVENRNRGRVTAAQLGYLNNLAASAAQRQNVVDNALTEQLAIYNQDRQLGYDLRVKSDQYAAQQQLASVREKYNNMLQSYRNNNPSKVNATLTDMFIEFPQLKAQMEREVAEINNNFTQQQLKTAGRWGRQSSFPVQFAKKGGSVYQRKPVSEVIWEDNNKEAHKAVRQLSKQAYEFLKMALK